MALCTYVCSNPFSLRIHLTDAFFLYKRIKNHKLQLTPKGDTWECQKYVNLDCEITCETSRQDWKESRTVAETV